MRTDCPLWSVYAPATGTRLLLLGKARTRTETPLLDPRNETAFHPRPPFSIPSAVNVAVRPVPWNALSLISPRRAGRNLSGQGVWAGRGTDFPDFGTSGGRDLLAGSGRSWPLPRDSRRGAPTGCPFRGFQGARWRYSSAGSARSVIALSVSSPPLRPRVVSVSRPRLRACAMYSRIRAGGRSWSSASSAIGRGV
jgi:hypothetical protein